ncbi:MAG TPA: DUF488 domain-containing protein [Acidobacteriaceae bacterium]
MANLTIYSIGFTQRTAEDFFNTLRNAGIRRLMDVRLNNTSQLAAFAKRDDLRFFLREICDADYVHEPLLAPKQEMLDVYKKKKGSWAEYEMEFLNLMKERQIESQLSRDMFTVPTALLCSEHTADNCHRRLVLEYLAKAWGGVTISHL